MKNRRSFEQPLFAKAESKPFLKVSKIGIVTRDYRTKFSNGYRDFSYTFENILLCLDQQSCDTVLFSLFSIIPRKGYDPRRAFNDLKNIKVILLEEFQDGKTRKAGRYVIYYRTASDWKEYEFCQVFGTVTGMPRKEIYDFVENEVPKRIMGNCCVLLCGETNGVKYSKKDKKINDTFGLRKAIPPNVAVILNPIHDRMTRFEMKLKRQYLSKNKRWVVSVWNKGKSDKNGKIKDGKKSAWTIYYDGKEKEVKPIACYISNQVNIEIGVLNLNNT